MSNAKQILTWYKKEIKRVPLASSFPLQGFIWTHPGLILGDLKKGNKKVNIKDPNPYNSYKTKTSQVFTPTEVNGSSFDLESLSRSYMSLGFDGFRRASERCTLKAFTKYQMI